jgi:hypothetical protein
MLSGAGHVEDVFLVDGAVEVVGAEAQGDLGEFVPRPDPVGGEVIEVVEVEAADRDGADGVVGPVGGVFDRDRVVLGLIGQRNETGETAGLVLELAELPEVIDAVSRDSTWP